MKELNIIKIIRNLRNHKIFNHQNGLHEKTKFKVKHNSRNVIEIGNAD